MHKKKMWRYYCDFCKKSGASAQHMHRHEAVCTRNPNRVCGFCRAAGLEQKPMPELIEALGTGSDLTAIRELSENCPACILAAIIQSKLQYPMDDDGPGFWIEFDYQKERDEFWKEVNSNREPEYY